MPIYRQHFTCLKILIFLVFAMPICLRAQSLHQDSLIRLNGVLYDSQSNAPVKGKITYEKLPYGDDFGIAHADSVGRFQVLLIYNNKYLINIKAAGYLAYKEEIAIADSQKVDSFSKTFYLVPTGVGQVLRIKNLYFDQSTSNIPEQAYEEINVIVRMLKENPEMVVQLEGHTDFRGSSRLNNQLSQERVETIRDYMAAKGIERKRIKLKAFGGSKPLSTDDGEDAKKANRRVEVRVLQL